MKWKRRSTSDQTVIAPATPADPAVVAEMSEWIRVRAALIDAEERERAGRDGFCDAVDANTVAGRIAATSELPLNGPDVFGFANIVALVDDPNDSMYTIPVVWKLEGGEEARAELGNVVAVIRKWQPQLFELLVEMQRLRNKRLDEAGDDYIDAARARVAGN